MHRVFLAVFIFFTFFVLFPNASFAQDDSYITIVNPQRISSYTNNYLESFRAELEEMQDRNLSATWPITYDVLLKDDFVQDLKHMGSNQELGLFLEVTPNLCKAANVSYNKTDSWHRATSLFLSGYSQNDRKKLIDTVFKKFKTSFGYYPVSIGGWWVDAFSLSYMKQKYDITGVLGMSDQYDLDGYQLWGTWWSVPYYPSSLNAALPAQNSKDKLDIVTFRWAARDPLNGYGNTRNLRNQPSLYSIQDYSTIKLNSLYAQKLTETFAVQKPQNKFGQVTLGLEGDLNINDYKTYFHDHLDSDALKNTRIVSMKQFSEWYRKKFPNISPNHIIYSEDLLGSSQSVIWYQSPFYRIGLIYDSVSQTTKIIDLRQYFGNFIEPNYQEPNKQLTLSIILPFIIDSETEPNSEITLHLGRINNVGSKNIDFEKGTINFNEHSIYIPGKNISFLKDYPVSKKGILIRNYSVTIPFSIKRKFSFLPTTIFFPIPKTHYISQTEYEALMVLKNLPAGKVLVYDESCLKCAFLSQYKPLAATGDKSYVSTYSNKPVERNLSFLLSKSSIESKNILKKKNVRYIYLAKYEDYIEQLPYLPQDLGLKKVYQNANAEIWKDE